MSRDSRLANRSPHAGLLVTARPKTWPQVPGSLDRGGGRSLNAGLLGAVAQLGERSNRTAEVVGSIPSGSTKTSNYIR